MSDDFDLKDKTVLVVDDNTTNLAVVCAHLAEAGIKTMVAYDGQDALATIQASLPALILLDIMLPDMDGFEICRRLKLAETTQAIPVIFMTARDDIESIINGFAAGGVDYITKPFRHEEMAARVVTHLKIQTQQAHLNQVIQELELFSHAASHDLQEPVQVMLMYLSMLQQRCSELSSQIAGFAEMVELTINEAWHMQHLISDLLDFSRISARDSSIEPIECSELLTNVLADLKAVIEDTGAEITGDCLPGVKGDRVRLAQLFQNLIGNALKFRRRDIRPRIHISAESRGYEWLFGVHDNGIGIEEQYFERIFTPFQRLHTREEFAGSGLGLAVCQKIVERHGGRIWVESEPGNGSAFYFTLPAKG